MPLAGVGSGMYLFEAGELERMQHPKPAKKRKGGGLWSWVAAHLRRKKGRIEKVKAHKRRV